MHTFTAKMALPFWLKLESLLEKLVKTFFSLSLSFLIAMAASSFDVDTIVPEQTEGVEPPVSTAGMGSLDSFQHVEAVMKEDDVSTIGFDSQDWEMVSDMVAHRECCNGLHARETCSLGRAQDGPPVFPEIHGGDDGKSQVGSSCHWR